MEKNKDKVVLVTGAAQGIGKAIAQAFSHEGYRLFICDIDEEAGKETVEWMQEKGAELHYIKTDVSQEAEVKKLFKEIEKRVGRLDVLVNNAGVSVFKKMEENEVSYFDEVINSNLRSAYLCSKYAAPLLKQQKAAAILNIASTRALMSEPDSEAYAASKGGLLALTHSMARSLGPAVRVNAISPGWIEVRDWKKSSKREEVDHREVDKQQHLVGRVGTPEDVGRAAVFLCGAEAGFVTGQNLVIDGGMTVKMIYEG